MRKASVFLVLFPLLSHAESWKTLFNGKDLKGWHQCNGTASYKVTGKTITGTTSAGSPNSFLCSDKEYGDFVLEFEVQNDPELNSGVQIRSHQYAKEVARFPAGRVYGYQVEIANEKSDASGGIYDEARRAWLDNVHCGAYQDNQWNKYRVEARGDSIKTWINGKVCADLVDAADQSGFLALQVHAFKGEKPKQVRWRNLRIDDLGRSTWKPLTGWEHQGGGNVEVKDGVIRLAANVADKQRGGFYETNADYGDFTLRLNYKITKGNSGVFYRKGERNRRVFSYEIEVDPTRDLGGFQEPGGRGWILHTPAEMFQKYYRATDWNEMVISAHGRRHAIFVNGVKTAEFKDDPGPLSGRIALQLNVSRDLEAFYKDIELLETRNVNSKTVRLNPRDNRLVRASAGL